VFSQGEQKKKKRGKEPMGKKKIQKINDLQRPMEKGVFPPENQE